MNLLAWIAEWQQAFCTRFTLTLLHCLWQGAALGLIVLLVAHIKLSARVRYAVNLSCLLLMVVLLPVTLSLMPTHPSQFAARATSSSLSRTSESRADPVGVRAPSGHEANPPIATAVISAAGSKLDTAPARHSVSSAENQLVLAAVIGTLVYFVGALLMFARLAQGLWRANRLQRSSTPVRDTSILNIVRGQANRIALRAVPLISCCERIGVPVVLGIVRPTILIPSSLLCGLAPAQFEAIITHELAHIRRLDLLANLMQRIAESMLFFHPAVWYVSRRVSIERENCCDDCALGAGCERMQYTDALIRMAELYGQLGEPAAGQIASLAVSGHNSSQLRNRVMRLLGENSRPALRLTRVGVFTTVLLSLSLAFTPSVYRNIVLAQSSEARPVDDTPEPFDVRIVDATTGKQITGKKLSVSFLFREPTVDGEQGKEITHLIWASTTSQISFLVADEAMNHPQRDQLMVHWGVGHPDYHILQGTVSLGAILRDKPKSARDGLRILRLLPKQTLVETALKASSSYQAEDEALFEVLSKLQQQSGVPLHIDQKKLWKLDVDPTTKVTFNLKNGTIGQVLRRALAAAGLTFEAKANGVQIPASKAQLVIDYDIPNSLAEEKIIVQHIGGRGDIGSVKYGPSKWTPLKNGEQFSLDDLDGGKYQVARYRMIDVAKAGQGRMLRGHYIDHQLFQLEPGQTRRISFKRTGARQLKGQVVGLVETGLESALVCVHSADEKEQRTKVYDARNSDKQGAFQTDPLAPGKYILKASVYETVTQEELRFTGRKPARYVGKIPFTVTKEAELPLLKVELEDRNKKP